MRLPAYLLIWALFAPGLMSYARGQNAEAWFHGGKPSMQNNGLGTIFVEGDQNDITLEGKWSFGARVTYNVQRRTGHELFYTYINTEGQSNRPGFTLRSPRSGVHAAGYSFLYYATPVESRVRPFVTGGVHLMHYSAGGSSVFLSKNRRFGLNYGGGLKVRLTERWGVRIDLRQYTNPKPDFYEPHDGWIRTTEASGGFGFYF